MAGKPNPLGKSRKQDEPYLIFTAPGWEWRVLKAYTSDPNAPYARWFCAVKGPGTFGGVDLGDTYIESIVKYGTLTYVDPSLAPVLSTVVPRGASISADAQPGPYPVKEVR